MCFGKLRRERTRILTTVILLDIDKYAMFVYTEVASFAKSS